MCAFSAFRCLRVFNVRVCVSILVYVCVGDFCACAFCVCACFESVLLLCVCAFACVVLRMRVSVFVYFCVRAFEWPGVFAFLVLPVCVFFSCVLSCVSVLCVCVCVSEFCFCVCASFCVRIFLRVLFSVWLL